MKFTQVDKLEPGMMLVKPIYDERGVCLVAANKVLTTPLIRQIDKLGYPGAYVFDKYTEFEEYNQIISEDDRNKLAKSLERLNIDQVLYMTNNLVNSMLEKDDLLLDLTELRNHHNYTYQHSINVSMLSTACGIGLGLTVEQLNDLALAAMLHDIGKSAIDKEILDKPGALTPEERKIIEQHPRFGYNMIYSHIDIDSYVRTGILYHHENWDGSGYPNQLRGDDIPLFARIIHVADVYDALCAKRAYKEEYNPAEALEYLMGNCGIMFDYDIVKTFIRYVVVYPVGIDVDLSTGQVARVIKNRAESVLRPIVMLEDGTTLDLARDRNCVNITILSNDSEYKTI